MQIHSLTLMHRLLMGLCVSLSIQPLAAAPDATEAARIFAEAKEICERDGAKMWGQSLCGPILRVDYTDLAVITNQADTDGALVPDGHFFRGVLPETVILANTPTEWSGTRWTQLVGPLPEEVDKRRVLLAHELFHRIQPSLGLSRTEITNSHLDSFDGRYLLQLEWRALARALKAKSVKTRRQATADALAFRQQRYRLFAGAAESEAALEINEAIAEYTGVKLGLTTGSSRVAFALHDLTAFVSAPTFVRSFAYATGPAYGLLLDQADPAWLPKFGALRFDELLGAALKLPVTTSDAQIEKQMARYDDGTLRASEVRRDEERQARLLSFKARLLDGPVLLLPLNQSNYQFNPQTLVPLDGLGTVYPTMRLTDDWGSLQVEQGGALVRGKAKLASVTAVGADAAGTSGEGWRLKLNPGWQVRQGDRPGDLVVTQDKHESQ